MLYDNVFKKWIKNNEGYKSHLYKDSVDKLTIGWGRNIQDKGVSFDEAELMFENDLKNAINDIADFPWYIFAPDDVKKALVHMSFNLGLPRLLTFKKMIQALKNKNYRVAAMEVLDSKWALQVGQRAKDIALVIREAK